MNLFFRRFGQGFPVIIQHGLFGLSDNWVTFGRELSREFDVLIPDLRNHGRSTHSTHFDIPSLAMDLEEFILEHRLQRPVLIGHSLGGKVAMQYTLEHSDGVEKLVVVDISPRTYPMNPEHQLLITAMMSVDFSTARSRSEVEHQLAVSIPDRTLRQFLLKSVYWRNSTSLDWRLNLVSLRENLSSVFEGVMPEREYSGPTLFIRGENSPYIVRADEPLIQKKFPQASIVTIPGASHWVHADAPAEFFRVVSGFLFAG